LQKKSKILPNADMALDTKLVYQFHRFRLDPSQHLLLHEGKPVPLTPKAFELLTILLENSGLLLTKDELMRRLWPDSFVEEANLTVNISALRKALGDSQDGQQFIETVPKHGYRFSAAVTEVGKESESTRRSKVTILQPIGGPAPEVSPKKLTRPAPKSRTRVIGIALLILGIALVGVGYFAYRQRSTGRHPLETRRRLAILPFQNLRRDPDSDFLGYSLADAVITKLGYVQALRVRPSYAIWWMLRPKTYSGRAHSI
jgi:DNA-binding winged helix-turn-helix (wHTH) protein